MMSLQSILNSQCSWAGTRPRKGVALDRLEDNLFASLHPLTLADFVGGSGDELGLKRRSNRVPNMRSLRSSSILVCNVFDPWRGHSLDGLARALGLQGPFSDLAFEQKLPHGLSSGPPNLDVLLSAREVAPVGVESKFTEIYGRKKPRFPIDEKYFSSGRRRWAEVGLPCMQKLAETLGRSVQFRRLDAAQLLKHSLGLAFTFRQTRPVRLLYIWFEVPGQEAEEHREELARFEKTIGTDIEFYVTRYQDVFTRLAETPEPVQGYLEYLASRYFAAQHGVAPD
jgi:hypothetical protein